MNRVTTEEVLIALRALRTAICGYLQNDGKPHRCDCKFGFTGGKRVAEVTGCPELGNAIEMIEASSE